MALMGLWAGTDNVSLTEGCDKTRWLPSELRTSVLYCLATVSIFATAQSFGFWRIAASNLAAVFMGLYQRLMCGLHEPSKSIKLLSSSPRRFQLYLCTNLT